MLLRVAGVHARHTPSQTHPCPRGAHHRTPRPFSEDRGCCVATRPRGAAASRGRWRRVPRLFGCLRPRRRLCTGRAVPLLRCPHRTANARRIAQATRRRLTIDEVLREPVVPIKQARVAAERPIHEIVGQLDSELESVVVEAMETMQVRSCCRPARARLPHRRGQCPAPRRRQLLGRTAAMPPWGRGGGGGGGGGVLWGGGGGGGHRTNMLGTSVLSRRPPACSRPPLAGFSAVPIKVLGSASSLFFFHAIYAVAV